MRHSYIPRQTRRPVSRRGRLYESGRGDAYRTRRMRSIYENNNALLKEYQNTVWEEIEDCASEAARALKNSPYFSQGSSLNDEIWAEGIDVINGKDYVLALYVMDMRDVDAHPDDYLSDIVGDMRKIDRELGKGEHAGTFDYISSDFYTRASRMLKKNPDITWGDFMRAFNGKPWPGALDFSLVIEVPYGLDPNEARQYT